MKGLDQIDEKIANLLLEYTKANVQFQYFKSYDSLRQGICELINIFSSNLTDLSRADFVESTAYLTTQVTTVSSSLPM